jgi:nicotinamidase-related amidase
MHTLVIVDMQKFFTAANNVFLVKSIKREIELSKKHNWPIIVLEYNECGRTKSSISSQLWNYPYKYITKKFQDDGSFEAFSAITKLTKSKNIRIVGVNTDACVISTAYGLMLYNYNVTFVNDGCRSDCLNKLQNSYLKTISKKYGFNILRNNIKINNNKTRTKVKYLKVK